MEFCLDEESPSELSNLTPIQRYYLYQALINPEINNIHVKTKYRINSNNQTLLPSLTTLSIDYFLKDNSSKGSKLEEEKITNSEVLKLLDYNKLGELADGINVSLYEVYDDVNIETSCYLEFIKLINKNLPIKKCKNCNKYFINTKRLRTSYCDRIFNKEGQKCSEVGPSNIYNQKLKENPIMKVYDKAYKKNYARIGYGIIKKDDFKIWAKKARELRDDALEGNITFEEFSTWIDESSEEVK